MDGLSCVTSWLAKKHCVLSEMSVGSGMLPTYPNLASYKDSKEHATCLGHLMKENEGKLCFRSRLELAEAYSMEGAVDRG